MKEKDFIAQWLLNSMPNTEKKIIKQIELAKLALVHIDVSPEKSNPDEGLPFGKHEGKYQHHG